MFILFLIVMSLSFLRQFRALVDIIMNSLGWPMIFLGVFFLGLSLLGNWLRKVANRSSELATKRRDTSTT